MAQKLIASFPLHSSSQQLIGEPTDWLQPLIAGDQNDRDSFHKSREITSSSRRQQFSHASPRWYQRTIQSGGAVTTVGAWVMLWSGEGKKRRKSRQIGPQVYKSCFLGWGPFSQSPLDSVHLSVRLSLPILLKSPSAQSHLPLASEDVRIWSLKGDQMGDLFLDLFQSLEN